MLIESGLAFEGEPGSGVAFGTLGNDMKEKCMATTATENSAPRYRDDDLVTFCEALYKARGMRDRKSTRLNSSHG